jgi:hypothetical protein
MIKRVIKNNFFVIGFCLFLLSCQTYQLAAQTCCQDTIVLTNRNNIAGNYSAKEIIQIANSSIDISSIPTRLQAGKSIEFTDGFSANYHSDLEASIKTCNNTFTAVIFQIGAQLTASNGQSYQWFLNEQPVPATQNGQSKIFFAQEFGSYKVKINLDNCQTTSLPVSVDVVTSNKKQDSAQSEDLAQTVSLFPNPTSAQLVASVKNNYYGEMRFIIRNQVGVEMYALSLNKNEYENTIITDFSFLPQGLYVVEVRFGETAVVKKILKQ